MWSVLNRLALWPFAINALSQGDRVGMFTSAECRAQAEQKLAQAEHDVQHRRRLITAAEAWLLLADQLGRAEAALTNDEVVSPKT
jgi:hypothetical protein